MIGGVCAALARYLEVDVSLVRVAFAFATLISGGIVCTVYLMLWVITPPSADGVAPLARFVNALRNLFSPAERRAAPGGSATT